MASDAQDLKARMMAEAEEVIDNLLAGAGEKESLMLSDIWLKQKPRWKRVASVQNVDRR